MNKKFIRLTESDLHKIIKESNNSHMTKLGRKLRLYFNKLTPIVLKRDNNTC